MRRNLFTWIPMAGILIQLVFCMPAIAANLKTTTTTKHRITGVVKDALGRPIKQVALSLQDSRGKVVAHATSNDAGEFSFNAIAPGTYAVVATGSGFKPATSIVSVSTKGAAPVALAMEAEKEVSLRVAATRLNQARNSLSPDTGGSKYTFTQQAIQELPQGNNTPLNQVLLQAPGVAQDSFGQIHVRGDHANLQYRINGVQLPEGITTFGQILSPRFAQSISLLTGALPAEYGLRTAGVIDIKTKDGLLDPVANVDFYGGQRGTTEPSFEYGGSKGNFSYYMTDQYIGTDRGLEPPTSGPTAIHDTANQGSAFGYFSYFINSTTRLSLITGSAVNHFQIPANPNQPQLFTLAGVPSYPSAKVRENQFEQNYFGVLALQGVVGENIDYQIAPFSRYSAVTFNPDHVGDLIYQGAASRVFRSDWGSGFQIDTAYHGIANHTFRLGGYFDAERAEIDNHEATFPAVGGVQSSSIPISIVDDLGLQTWIYSGYIQDEWKLTEKLTFNYGVRFDLYDGLVRADQASPRAALVYKPFKGTTLHAGYARQMTPPETELVQVGDIKQLKNTTGAPPSSGNGNPTVERDHLFDVGATQEVIPGLNIGIDSYYKKAVDLIDEGQFGPALIFETFNYAKGRVWGVEFTGSYTHENIYAYENFAYSVAQGTQVESGQFNFTPAELAYIQSHYIFLDHDQTFTNSAGVVYKWRKWMFSIDGTYGSGLRSGFANTGNLPFYIQLDAGITRRVPLPNNGGTLEFRGAIVNLNDRTYLVRNGTGVGVFANQFGPRRAVYGGIKWELPFTKPPSAIQ
ncbi:TonB-dependent receptor [Candidatus Binatus sp.]|uniref:TonB-dependent receptor n=1 Tax=Candidatus Binatus sp. TaxID=2811406 RepID=UPI003BAE7E3B